MSKPFITRPLPIDPGLLDPDFDICIIARANMSNPCKHCRGAFIHSDGSACWGGHIFLALGVNLYATIPAAAHSRATRIAWKLGFPNLGNLYQFNDYSSHAEVIARFDAALQNWPNTHAD